MARAHLARRTFLRGLGTSIALPFLEAMVPVQSYGVGRAVSSVPRRMAFVYVPNGIVMENWIPGKVGKLNDLPPTLEPLDAFKSDFQVLGGLDHHCAKSNGDGPGDHARATATFLTGCQAYKTPGSNIRLGISVDQAAAQKIGNATRFPSLELSCDRVRSTGSCDSGYSCAYQYNLSWKSDTIPMPPESNPRLVFERLFGSGNVTEEDRNRAVRKQYKQSILDYVLDEGKAMRRKLGGNDRRKLDEYLTSVREIEVRLERSEQFVIETPEYDKPDGVPEEYEEHLKLMFDMMTLAFQTDSTRIATFLMAHDGSNRVFRNIGISDGHHHISHHKGSVEKIEQLKKIDRFYVSQFAYFLDRLAAVQEGEGNLLDNSMILFGGGISDGNRHSHTDLPVLLAGRGGGSLNPGRYVRQKKNKPMNNLYLSMLERMDASVSQLGDSTGKLSDI